MLRLLAPVGIEAALQALEHHAEDRHAKRRQLELAIEQARFEAARAGRQFDAADPGNRLVTAELERRWNERLADVARREAEIETLDADDGTSLTPEQREELMSLGVDLPRVWFHPAAGNDTNKRILRCVIREIVARVADARIELLLHRQGGEHTELSVVKNRTGQHRWSADAEVRTLVTLLSRQLQDGSIAALLNRLGHRTGKGHTWTETRVRSFRFHHRIPVHEAGEREARGELTLEQASEALGTSKMSVLRMIAAGTLPGEQACKGAPWGIKVADIERLKAASTITGTKKAPLPADSRQISLELQ